MALGPDHHAQGDEQGEVGQEGEHRPELALQEGEDLGEEHLDQQRVVEVPIGGQARLAQLEHSDGDQGAGHERRDQPGDGDGPQRLVAVEDVAGVERDLSDGHERRGHEHGDQGGGKPRPLNQAEVELPGSMHPPAPPARRSLRGALDLIEERPERLHQWLGGVGPFEQLADDQPVVLVEIVSGALGQQLHRVHQALLGRPRPVPSDRPDGQEQENEDDVDHRRRRLEEVVVVGGDELADLVDEESEADAPHERAHVPPRATEVGEQDDDHGHHRQAAPQQMGDVQLAATELRIVRGPQLQADDQDHRHRSDEERVEQRPDLDAANGMGTAMEQGAGGVRAARKP